MGDPHKRTRTVGVAHNRSRRSGLAWVATDPLMVTRCPKSDEVQGRLGVLAFLLLGLHSPTGRKHLPHVDEVQGGLLLHIQVP